MAPDRWDVVVAGAGPAGATTAALLARQGWRVLLLDRAHFPRPKACAEYISPGLWSLFMRLDMVRALPSESRHAFPGMTIVSPRGRTAAIRYRVDGVQRLAMAIPRLDLDRALVEEAVRSGAQLREGVTVHAPLLQEGRVVGLSAAAEGHRQDVRARVVVAADGGHSVLARALNLSRPARWPVRLGLIAHYKGPANLPDGGGAMVVGKGGYCGLAPLPGGDTNVGLVVRADALQRSCLTASQFMTHWIANDPHLSIMLSGCEPNGGVRGTAPVGARATTPGAPGIVLVGDSAGFFDPFTGEGIHRAVLGAEIAAQIVTVALNAGTIESSAVREYAQARSRAFRRKQYVTALVQLFVQFPQLMEYALPRLSDRQTSLDTLGTVLGDLGDAGAFLHPAALWGALRP